MGINVAIVGSGRAARELHLPYFKEIAGCKVVALCDPELEWTKQLAQKHGVEKVYPNLGEALKNEKLDVVSVCSIPQQHLEDVRAALSSGCHVLLEKPMAMDMTEVKKMKEAQEASGKVLTVVHNYKFTQGIQQALSMIRSGLIGDILRIYATWMVKVEGDRMLSVPEHWSHKLKGGRWGETLPHLIYILYQMVGKMKVKSVQAKKVAQIDPWIRADEVSIALEHNHGYAEIELSANTNTRRLDFVVISTKGAILCDYGAANQLYSVMPPGVVIKEDIRLVRATAQAVLQKVRPTATAYGPTGHRKVVRGFVDEVLKGAPSLTPWDEAYHTMELVDKIGEGIDSQVK